MLFADDYGRQRIRLPPCYMLLVTASLLPGAGAVPEVLRLARLEVLCAARPGAECPRRRLGTVKAGRAGILHWHRLGA